jgi:hypothetical protein
VFLIVVFAGEGRGNSIMSEMCVNILSFISCTHKINKSCSGRFSPEEIKVPFT